MDFDDGDSEAANLQTQWDIFLKEETEAKKKFISWMLNDMQTRDRTNPIPDPDQYLTDQLKEYWEHWGVFLKEEQVAKNKFLEWATQDNKKQFEQISYLEGKLKALKNKNKSLMDENYLFIQKDGPKDSNASLATLELSEKPKSARGDEAKRNKQKANNKSNNTETIKLKAIDEMTKTSNMNRIETTPIKEMNLENKDNNNNMLLRILTENVFYGHQGFDLYERKKMIKENHYQDVQASKSELLKDLKVRLGNVLKFDASKMRLWPIAKRSHECLRPYAIDYENNQDKPIIDLLCETTIPLAVETVNGQSSWVLFLEDVSSKNHLSRINRFDASSDIILFLKYYDPIGKRIYFMGHLILSMQDKITALVKELLHRAKQRRLGMDQLTEENIFLYKECEPNVTKKIDETDWEETLETIGEDIMDGDILVFQKSPSSDKPCKFPTIQEYYADYYKTHLNKS